MIARLVLTALLAALGPPAHAGVLDTAYCRLWPHTAACRPPPVAPIPPPPPPVVMLPPFTAPVAVDQPPPIPAVKPRPAKKPVKWTPAAKEKRKATRQQMAVAGTWWCRLMPAGTTMAEVEARAPAWGVTMDAEKRAQARACLASK